MSAVPSLKRAAQNLNGYGVNQTVGAGLPSNVNSLGNGMAALTQRITQQGHMAMQGGQSALGSVCGGVNDPDGERGHPHGGLLTVPAGGGSAGWLNPHSARQPVTVSTSLMYSPSTDATINEAASAAAFRAGTYAYTASSANTSLATLLLSPNYNKVLNANNVVFYLTGIHFDGLYEDLTSTALSQMTWRVYLLTDGPPPNRAGSGLSNRRLRGRQYPEHSHWLCGLRGSAGHLRRRVSLVIPQPDQLRR